mmetsp:Transcript_19215/g.60435  ORF Transcript_19215/g.60435 Transcript_19215/m.60435 type:complete len:416 (+) Transcript_19215:109-1356(+)
MRMRCALWFWPCCVVAQLVDPLRWAFHGVRGAKAMAVEHRSRGGRGLLMRTVWTYDDLCSSVANDEATVVVGQDIPIAAAISISTNVTISSDGAGPFALDGQATNQILVIREPGDVVLEHLVLKNAHATTNGGAISVLGGALSLIKCTISASAAAFGGAVYVSKGSFRATESIFFHNSAPDGGGAVVLLESTMVATGCQFRKNSAALGGAVYVGARSRLNVSDSLFASNRAATEPPRATRGGALYFTESEGSLRDSELSSNYADEGGAVATFLAVVSASTLTMTQNSARYGGALALKQSQLTDAGSTIRWNSAEVSGGGVYLSSKSTLDAAQSTIKDNEPEDVKHSTTSSSWNDGFADTGLTPPGDFAPIAEPEASRRKLDAHTMAPTYTTPAPIGGSGSLDTDVPTYSTPAPSA